LTVRFRVQVEANFVAGLVLHHRDAMRLGLGILTNAGELPGDLHPR